MRWLQTDHMLREKGHAFDSAYNFNVQNRGFTSDVNNNRLKSSFYGTVIRQDDFIHVFKKTNLSIAIL